jgi:hypothetical protein
LTSRFFFSILLSVTPEGDILLWNRARHSYRAPATGHPSHKWLGYCLIVPRRGRKIGCGRPEGRKIIAHSFSAGRADPPALWAPPWQGGKGFAQPRSGYCVELQLWGRLRPVACKKIKNLAKRLDLFVFFYY